MGIGLPIIETGSEESSDILVFDSCHFEMLVVGIIKNVIVKSAKL